MKKIPLGVKVIIILFGLSILSSVLAAFRAPTVQLGPIVVDGAGVIAINLGIAAILGVFCYGLITRKKWARTGIIAWYILSMAIMCVNLVTFIRDPLGFLVRNGAISGVGVDLPGAYTEQTIDITRWGLIASLIFGSVVGICIIVYLVRKKEFFTR